MNKTLNVNIGGRVFHIDEDAYYALNQYLDQIKKELNMVDGQAEIYMDIESRVGELLALQLHNIREIITLADVQEIIKIMGKPEDITGNNEEKINMGTGRKYKRMYRDPDNRIIGGVCSGLSYYWGIDPTIVRLIFIILLLFGMAGGLIYIILWIVMPEANSIAQKLEMRGEPVNLSNMGEFFRDEFENVKKNFKRK